MLPNRRALLAWFLAPLTAAAALTPVAVPPSSGTPVWTQVGTGITSGISGLAPSATGWVVVRDNKEVGQNRVALLSNDGVVTALTWPGTAPKDLEAIAAVPGQADRYVVVNSAGVSRLIAIADTTMSIVKKFKLPAGTVQNEAFALTTLGGSTVAVWGSRGSPTTPGRLYAAVFNPTTATFGAVTSRPVTVPYPTRSVRHVSDAALIGSRIVISSAMDRGNNGPFDSALYDVGNVGVSGGVATLALTAPASLGVYSSHKIEALGCRGSTGLLGTDDENLGGWISPDGFCG